MQFPELWAGWPVSRQNGDPVCFGYPVVYVCPVFGSCSNEGESGGPGEAPNTAVSVSLQGDRTTGDWQDGVSPGLSGTQFRGIAPSV